MRPALPRGFRASPLLLSLSTLVAWTAFPHAARAGSIALDHYRGAPTAEDSFTLSRPGDLGHLRWGVRLDFDYALDPIVYETDQGASRSEVGAVVADHLVGRLTGALGLVDRLVIYLGLPLNMMMSGTKYVDMPGPDGTLLGDLFVGMRGRIWGEPDDLFALAAQATLTVPTAELYRDAQSFAGENTCTGLVQILAELRWQYVIVTANVGAFFRKPTAFGALDVGHELAWALGLAFPAIPGTLAAYVEAWGATTFATFGDREASPIEVLAGLRVWAAEGLSLSLAGGSGTGRGYGSPDFRAVLSFGWSTPEEL
jgi:hypothetical protein